MKILFCVIMLFGSLTAIASNENVFSDMSLDERRSFFGTEDGSIPKHEVVELVLPSRSKRSSDEPISILFNAAGIFVTASVFNADDSKLIHPNLTTVWTAEPSGRAYQSVAYTPQPRALEAVGNIRFYQNVDEGSSLTIFRDGNGDETILGILRQHYTIKSVPMRFQYALVDIRQQHDVQRRSVNSMGVQDEKKLLLAIFKNDGVQDEYVRRFTYAHRENHSDPRLHRTRRQRTNPTDEPNIIYPKLLIVPDSSVVTLHEDHTDLLRHLIARLHFADTIFRQLNDPQVYLRIAAIIIPLGPLATHYLETNYPDSRNTIQADFAMDAAQIHFTHENYRFPQEDWQLILILTRRPIVTVDVGSEDHVAVHGYTRPSLGCSGTASIVEFSKRTESVYILVHELGHMFAIPHDQDVYARESCTEVDGYLMANHYGAAHKLEWSPCNRIAFARYFKSHAQFCIDNETPNYRNEMPGSRLGLIGQCQNICFTCTAFSTFEDANPIPANCSIIECLNDRLQTVALLQPMKGSTMTARSDLVQYYTDWERAKDGYMYQEAVADVVGDYFFICPSTHFAQLFAERGMKVYYYFFTQRTSTNLWGKWMGVLHGDEVEYVFGHPLNMSLQYTEKERELSTRMIRAYSRFAFLGKPMEGNDWPPYTRDDPQYYIFNAEKHDLGKGPRTTSCAFWNEFLPRLEGIADPVPETCNSAVASSVSAGAKDLRGSLLLLILPVLAFTEII